MALNQSGGLIISGLRTHSKWVHSFLVEVYLEAGLTTLVHRAQPICKWDAPSLSNVQQEPCQINGLVWGQTYYVRVGVVKPVDGTITWSPAVQMVAGQASAGGPAITAPYSHPAVAGEYLTGYDATTGAFSAAPATFTNPVAFTVVFANKASGRVIVPFVGSSDFTLTLTAGLTTWRASVGTNPSATKTYSFKKSVYNAGAWGAPTEFGTLQITDAGVLTWASASDTTIGNNEKLLFYEPSDTALADVSITVHGTR